MMPSSSSCEAWRARGRKRPRAQMNSWQRDKQLCAQGRFEQGVDLLKIALQLDDRTAVRNTLRDLFVTRAQESLNTDWRAVEAFADRALELDANHTLARSLRAQALDRKREEFVPQIASQARRLQAAGDFTGALKEVENGLAAYPGDAGLVAIAETLRKELHRAAAAAAPPPSPPPPHSVDRTRLVPERKSTPLPTPAEEPASAQTTEIVPAPKRTTEPSPPTGRSFSRPVVWAAVAAAVVVVVVAVLVMRTPDESETVSVETPAAPVPTPVDVPAPPAAIPEATPPAPAPASLVLQQLPAGAEVVLDGAAIGTVDQVGTLSYSGISPGPHTLSVSMRGFAPATITREFAAGQTLVLSSTDVGLRRTDATIDLVADTDTQITISQGGQAIQTFTGGRKVPLSDGTYEIAARGPSGIPTLQTLTVAGGTSRTVNLRNIAAGMEGFDLTTWTKSDNWYTRRGGAMVIYERRNSNGRFTFTIRLDQSGNPFSSGARLTWTVGFIDNTNYVMLQLDKDSFYRSELVSGNPVPSSILRAEHRIPTNVPFVHLSTEVSNSRVVQQYSLDGTTWRPLDTWERPASARPLANGRFGFFMPGNEELFVSNFAYHPPSR